MKTKQDGLLNLYRMFRSKLALAGLLCLFCVNMATQSAFAHQQKLALSKVVYNPRANTLEVMHRFELHDAEHAVKEIFGNQADIIQSHETQSQFAEYVYARFGLYRKDDTPIKLTPIGFEVDGKHFWVYQEAPAPDTLEGIQVVHNALRDIWFAQTNTVNIEVGKDIDTLTFTDNTEVLSVDFR
uniref:DUF6702 family protein n=1 Tax=Ningiella ruwaisensis TaxID=2364274 RepID=UPI001F4FE763|nr:DUF6702 family protein [Ningiella ruwaisensis]